MTERGYNKTSKQMQTRFKTLRVKYNKIIREMGKSGSGNNLDSFLYAEEMGQILHFRPITTCDTVDSTPIFDNDNDNDNSNNYSTLYEDAPDERDGAIPGCSSGIDDELTSPIPTIRRLNEDTSEDSNSTNQSTPRTTKKRKISRSHEAVAFRYADRLKQYYEEVQNKIIAENRCIIATMMESEKEIANNILDRTENILLNTTTQLITAFKEIVAPLCQHAASTALNTEAMPSASQFSTPHHTSVSAALNTQTMPSASHHTSVSTALNPQASSALQLSAPHHTYFSNSSGKTVILNITGPRPPTASNVEQNTRK